MNEQNTEFTSEEQQIVQEKLAQIYAAPADPAYWSDLQVRILSRISDSDAGMWWVFLGRWSRAGVVAAALALMAAGIASVVTQQRDELFAEENALDAGMPVVTAPNASVAVTTFERVSSMVGVSEDEAAVRYVLSLLDGTGR
jgi:hypothetical protein